MITLETRDDKFKEQFVIRRLFNENPEVQWFPFPQFASVDYVGMRDGQVESLVEVKTRKEPMHAVRQYPGGLLLKRRKFSEVATVEVLLNVPTYVVFAFSNGTGHVLAARPAELKPREDVLTGRRDRGLATDEEPVVLLDWDTELVTLLEPLEDDK